MTAKVMVALAVALLPPGVVAVGAALRSYQDAVAHGESSRLGLAQALSIALPILMWFAALAIGWIIARHLIVRPLTQMRDAVENYTRGDKDVRLSGQRFFSREVAELAAAFDSLADDIKVHDAELVASLVEQKRLTREVHHRVKNNLQIVSSLLSIQSRDAASAEVAHAYAVVQARVAALAVVHRWMYESDAPGDTHGVDLKALATDLAAGLEQSLAASEQINVSIVPHVERLFVSQDTAVPLAFLITELISCAARSSAPDALAATVSASQFDGRAVLTIAARVFVGGDILAAGRTHPSSRIVGGMARQLRTPLVHDPVAGSYAIAFTLPAQ
ncbi:HAMP domain-containing protein [Sphingosinicellaceae bacterium]|nr:HAMP domain-containing protein [Sphingosinicellaceae bacterium]